MPLLSAIQRKSKSDRNDYPFSVPLIASFDEFTFQSKVTIVVGENGSGKSTFLEAIACSARMATIGSESINTDPTLKAARALAKELRLVWTKKSYKGFFLRAEDFFGYAKQIAQTRAQLKQELREMTDSLSRSSDYARQLASMPFKRELGDMQSRYGEGLDAQSHGESFIKLFESRMIAGGLYILDEPEAPLSPIRQLGLLGLIREMVDDNCQFIIATHSPILMALPGASIIDVSNGTFAETAFDEVEHVKITKRFLNNPEAYLRHL
jgi:predicted ATPase